MRDTQRARAPLMQLGQGACLLLFCCLPFPCLSFQQATTDATVVPHPSLAICPPSARRSAGGRGDNHQVMPPPPPPNSSIT